MPYVNIHLFSEKHLNYDNGILFLNYLFILY